MLCYQSVDSLKAPRAFICTLESFMLEVGTICSGDFVCVHEEEEEACCINCFYLKEWREKER